jgi:hypothetical protein
MPVAPQNARADAQSAGPMQARAVCYDCPTSLRAVKHCALPSTAMHEMSIRQNGTACSNKCRHRNSILALQQGMRNSAG